MFASGAIIYAYVGGNPVNYTDPKGLAAGATALCFIPGIGPVSCAAAGAATGAIICALNPQLCKKAIEGCFDGVTKMFAEPKQGSAGGEGARKPFSDKVKEKAREESGNTCVFCGTETTDEPGPTRSEIDHAIPKSRDGNNTQDNAQNTCRTCNRQKGAQTTDEFLQ